MAVLLSNCSRPPTAPAQPPIERQAREFVALGLALGRSAPAEVDSYFGPASLQPSTGAPAPSLAALSAEIAQLQQDLGGAGPDRRHRRLQERTRRLAALVDLMQAKVPPRFDDEARRLYGLDPEAPEAQRFREAHETLEALLPGPGSLTQRVEAFRARFVVPERLRPAVFARALAECRARTLRHWKFPPDERLDIEWSSDAGAAWHRYLGGFHSRLTVNPQAVAFLGSMIDVACHEGYPGHHAQFVLAEADAGKGRLPTEDRIVLLRSPGSVVREGAADYGVALVFPPPARLAFERDVLFPLSGFSPREAARFEQIRSLLDQLAPAALPILRAYRDHDISAEAAVAALDRDALIASPQALLAFVDRFGAYVTGYTGVREQVRSIVDTGTPLADEVRWARLRCLHRLADEAPLSSIAAAIGSASVPARSCEAASGGGAQPAAGPPVRS